MKVVHINGGGETGGGKSHLLTLLPELRKAGCDASLIVFSSGLLLSEAKAAGIPTSCLGVSRMMSWKLFRNLYLLLRSQQPDIVHTHGGRANLYGRLAARLAGIKCVATTVHSYSDLDYVKAWHNTWFSLVDKLTWFLTNRFVAVSYDLERSLRRRGVKEMQVSVVPNGIVPWEGSKIDVRREFALSAGPIVCAVGRFVPVKRFDLLLQAFVRVLAEFPETTLLLIGEGPLLWQLKNLVKTLGVENRVVFTGYRADARMLLSNSDLFVMSSDMEGLPVVLLEALSAGVPVVATAVGGIPEVVRHGDTALLTPRGEAEPLAAAITDTLRDRASAMERANRGREWFLGHGTAQRMGEKTLALYHKWSENQDG